MVNLCLVKSLKTAISIIGHGYNTLIGIITNNYHNILTV